jgi:hypothetical protein
LQLFKTSIIQRLITSKRKITEDFQKRNWIRLKRITQNHSESLISVFIQFVSQLHQKPSGNLFMNLSVHYVTFLKPFFSKAHNF